MRLRRSDSLSIALSAAIAAVLLLRLLPDATPTTVKSPEPTAEPDPVTDPARRDPAPVALTTVTLPPPPSPVPAPHRSAPSRPIDTAAPASEIRKPLQPTSAKPAPVHPLRPSPPAAASEPVRRIQALQPRPAPAADHPIDKPLTPTPAIRPAEASPAPRPPETVDRLSTPETPTPAPPVSAGRSPAVGTTDSKPIMTAGRPLLRLLEHGDGPRIDIAWPAAAGARETLFHVFERCYGMQVALMTPGGDLFRDGPDAAAWRINRDRYSGFVRQSGAAPTDREQDWRQRIRSRHPTTASAVTVRIFPRNVDAMLMGGLQRLVGDRYRGVKSIDARYEMRGQAVFIDNILADGIPVNGRINLSAAAAGCRHRGPA